MSRMPGEGMTFEPERGGALSYVAALRAHWLLVVLVVALAVGGAIAYVSTATKKFEAEADILVSPVEEADPNFVGFSLLRVSNDSSRSIITAARLIKTPRVAEAVKRSLDLPGSRASVLDSVTVTPISQADIVSVVGSASTAAGASELANAFARQTVNLRTADFQRELRTAIEHVRSQLASQPATQRDSPFSLALQDRLGTLTGLIGQPDPTLRVVTPAVPPEVQSWPRPVLSVAVALLASTLLGVGLAIALELLGPKIAREDELLLSQRLPVLARVPRMTRERVRAYLLGKAPLPPDVREAYRTLRANLATGGRDAATSKVVVVTSATPSEGKTMTAMNLAITLAAGGQRTILVDADLRRPMVGSVFGVPAQGPGFAEVLTGTSKVKSALRLAPGYETLGLLLAAPEHAGLVDLMDPAAVARVVDELRLCAEVVVFDTPPLTEVADALAIAEEADVVLLAVRLGHSRRDRLAELRRTLARHGIAPAGFVVTTRARARNRGYGYGTSAGSGGGNGAGTGTGTGTWRRSPRRWLEKPAPTSSSGR
jgi:capsular exopolysaccharide synthesis family protein